MPAGLAYAAQRVVAEDLNLTPLNRARVSVAWTGGHEGPVFTDGQGRFEVVEVLRGLAASAGRGSLGASGRASAQVRVSRLDR